MLKYGLWYKGLKLNSIHCPQSYRESNHIKLRLQPYRDLRYTSSN